MDFRTVPSVRRGQNLIVDNYLFKNKPGPAQVGAISKAQK